MQRRYRNTGPAQDVRDKVYCRDRLACVMCLGEYGLQIHHRTPRKAGGTSRPEINLPSNLIVLCFGCHSRVESQRELARGRGYLVPSHANPADVPILWRAAWVWLCDDGTAVPLGASDLAARDVLISDTGGEQDGAA